MRDEITKFWLFQFHKGAIRTRISTSQKYEIVYFNSIKVRLEPLTYDVADASTAFQFHKGAIRTIMRIFICSSQINFNSIKVRLELKKQIQRYEDEIFQFHKGAIRTDHPLNYIKYILIFQFHKGAIRTKLKPVCFLVAMRYFNSIKVRLELGARRLLQKDSPFQFHKGAIRT